MSIVQNTKFNYTSDTRIISKVINKEVIKFILTVEN